MAKGNQPIIVKKVKKGGHAHHGGAWKIAYADFVTAMMAFFLLMWLISMTTKEQKEGLAEYFAPTAVSLSNSGAGGVLGGNSMDDTGNLMSGSSSAPVAKTPAAPRTAPGGSTDPRAGSGERGDGAARTVSGDSEADRSSTSAEAYRSAAASIRQAWQSLPEVTPYASNLSVEETAEGIDIRIVDQEGRRMFARGSREPLEPARAAVAAVAPILRDLAAEVTISGHTAAGDPFDDLRYGPWELSADRANAVRAILSEYGLPDEAVASVIGRAAEDPYFRDDPYMAANERVTISVRLPPPTTPADLRP